MAMMNDAATGAADAAEIQRIVAGSGSSFYWAMRLLRRDRRAAMFAIYAFCRAVDDIADEDGPATEKQRQLAEWRDEIVRVYESEPKTGTGRALSIAIKTFGLAQKDFEAIIDGVEMDATGAAQAPDMATLELYCARVAGAVGLLSIKVFGDDSPAARRGALALGTAMQLTNILRDLAEDAGRGRLYLPREQLEAQGIVSNDPDTVLAHPAIGDACAAVAHIAEGRFRQAEFEFTVCSRKALRPALAMMAVYRLLLRRLQERGWTKLDERPRIGKMTRLWIALRASFA